MSTNLGMFDDDIQKYFDEAEKCIDRGEYKEAIEYYTKIIEEDNLMYKNRAYKGRFLAYICDEKYDNALQDSFRFEIESKNGKYLYYLGYMYEKTDNYEEALKSYETVPNNNEFYELAQISIGRVLGFIIIKYY